MLKVNFEFFKKKHCKLWQRCKYVKKFFFLISIVFLLYLDFLEKYFKKKVRIKLWHIKGFLMKNNGNYDIHTWTWNYYFFMTKAPPSRTCVNSWMKKNYLDQWLPLLIFSTPWLCSLVPYLSLLQSTLPQGFQLYLKTKH